MFAQTNPFWKLDNLKILRLLLLIRSVGRLNKRIVIYFGSYLFYRRLIEQYRSNVMEKLEKHRFLVLTKVVSDAEYDRIMEGNATNKQEELSKIWSSSSGNGKDDKRSLKLNVEYIYPRKGGTPSKPSKQTNSSLGGANNSSNTAVAVSTAAGISSHHAASNLNTQNTSSSASSSSDLKEIQELKVKYDAIVEYTVHLTAERDMIVTQLETLKKEYNNEIYKKKSESKSRTEEEKKHVPVVHTVSLCSSV